VNADGILKVKAKETRSDTKTEVVIKSQYGVSEEDMARMLLDSIQNAESDMKMKVLLEARNEAANILLGVDRFVAQNKEMLSEEQYAELARLRNELDDAKSGEDKDAINLAIQKVNDFTSPLAHLAMDKAIQDAMKGKKV
jgi:molecular chaperone HscA